MAQIGDEIKQAKAFRNEGHKALVNVLYTAHWLQIKQKVFFAKYDITATQFNVLRILRGSYPMVLSTSDIRERLIDRSSDASRIVDRLSMKDFVVKTTSAIDRRLVDVKISQKGLELLLMIEEKINDLYGVFNTLKNEEVKNLNDILDRLRG